jgi:hypothetical protein
MATVYLFTVEAQDDAGFWKAIDVFAGEKDSDSEYRANALRLSWINKGWPPQRIRVSESAFNKNIRREDDD